MVQPGPEQSKSTRPDQAGIDPRGPRFSAGITALLLLVVIALGLDRAGAPPAGIGERAGQSAFILFAAIAALFAWGAWAGVGRHPYGWLFKHTVRRWLGAPHQLEDPRPPTFSQGVGFVVTAAGLGLELLGVPYALVVFAALAFIAAFLNAVFDYCIGCQLYVVLVRLGLIRPTSSGRTTTT